MMSTTSHKSLAALGGSFLGTSTFVIALRFYTRRRQKAELRADDWLMLPCLALFIGWIAVVFVGIHNHILGYPQPTNPKVLIASQKRAVEIYMSINILSTATFALIKLSALFFYIRIFSPNRMRTPFKAVTVGTAVVVALWASAFIILLPMQCGTHFSMLWSPSKVVRQRYCWRADTELQAWVISDVILDAWIIGLPLPKIWNLKMSVRRKIGITSIFLLAFVGWASSIARMVMYIKAVLDIKAGRKGHSSRDTNSEVNWYTVLSGGMCLVAVNLPSIWFLFNKASPAPEKVLRSVRSILSLRSSRSSTFSKKGSSVSSKRNNYSKESASSEEGRPSFQGKLRPDVDAYEVYALRDVDLESGESVPPVPPIGNIRVKDTVSQTAELK